MKLKALLLLVVVLLPYINSQQDCPPFRSQTLAVGEVVYLHEVKDSIEICVVADCTGFPLPKIVETEVTCSEVNANCSAPSSPHEQNISICCQYCDECDFLNCHNNSQCVEDINGASCQCITGYEEITSNGQIACVDTDECASNSDHDCPSNSDCINLPGTFECKCHSGYQGDDCTDINECSDSTNTICPSNSECMNHDGFYECVCSEECNLDITSYYLTPPSQPEDFFDRNPSCSMAPHNFQDSSMVVCAGQQQLLTDKSTEASIPPTSSEYIGWETEALDGFTIIINANYTRLTRLDIHFYNHPSVGIGLPEVSSISVSSSSQANGMFDGPMSFYYANNEDLDQSDNRMRMVSIIITGSNDNIDFYRFVRVNFTFSSSQIWKTQLTEIQGYGGTDTTQIGSSIVFLHKLSSVKLGVSDIVSQVDLNCTVANSGYFLWEWTRTSDGSVLNSGVRQADLTRTSILTIKNLSIEDSGGYACRAFYNDESLAFEETDTIVLELDHEVIKNKPNPVSGSDVTLSCEFVGYYPKEAHIVVWDFEGRTLSQDDKYTVSDDAGSQYQSQNGSNSPGPSVISYLTISTVKEEDFGIYGCRIIGSYACSQLIGYIQISTTSSSVVSPPCSSTEPLPSLSAESSPSLSAESSPSLSAEPSPSVSAEPLQCSTAEPTTTILNGVVWFYVFLAETGIIIMMILVIIIVTVFYKFRYGSSYSTQFPNLTRPDDDKKSDIDTIDGIDFKINGVDWASMTESNV